MLNNNTLNDVLHTIAPYEDDSNNFQIMFSFINIRFMVALNQNKKKSKNAFLQWILVYFWIEKCFASVKTLTTKFAILNIKKEINFAFPLVFDQGCRKLI